MQIISVSTRIPGTTENNDDASGDWHGYVSERGPSDVFVRTTHDLDKALLFAPEEAATLAAALYGRMTECTFVAFGNL